MFEIEGRIVFDPKDYTKKHKFQSSWKKSAIVLLSCDTSKYYSWFLSNRFGVVLNPPLRGTHFTVINDRIEDDKEIAAYEKAKEKWNGKIIKFTYKPDYRTNGKHFWFRVYSEDAMKIRNDIGLVMSEVGFHLTVGLVNVKQKEHCEYVHRQMLNFPNNC